MAEKGVVLKADAWKKYLDKTGKTLKNIFPVLSAAVNSIGHKDVIDHFRKEKGPQGRWKRRSKATQIAYARVGKQGNKILQDEGKLRGGMLPARRVGRSTALMINDIPYAGIHNRGEGGMPKREFMWLSGRAETLILKAIMRKL